MTLGERIKKVRQVEGLTQQVFGERLGVKQNSIALIESGKRNPSDQLLCGIVREFNICKNWLQDGIEPMKSPTTEESVDELIRQHGLDGLDRQIILEFIKLRPEDRKAVKTFVQNIAKHLPKESEELTVEEEFAMYKAGRNSEKRTGITSLVCERIRRGLKGWYG